MEPEELVTVWEFRGEAEANLGKYVLENEDIRSVLIHENQSITRKGGPPQLLVYPRDYEKAKAILKDSFSVPPPRGVSPVKRWLAVISISGAFLLMAVLFAMKLGNIVAGIIAGSVGLVIIGVVVYFNLPGKSSKS